MMTKSKFNHETKLRILAILPVSVVVLLFTAGINGLFANNTNAESVKTVNKLQKTEISTATDTAKVKKVTVSKSSNTTSFTVKMDSDKKGESNVIYISNKNSSDSADAKTSVQVVRESEEMMIVADTIIVKQEKGKLPSNVIYIVDGIEQPEKSAIDKIDSKTIRKVEVYKGDQIKKFTTKECDGVILISTKKDADSSNVLYIVDGVEQPNAVKDIDPDNIEEIQIFKGENMKKYTTKDYDGVILIKTKKRNK